MANLRYEQVLNWEEIDILSLPSAESDNYEYKSSKTPVDKLKEKISIAASAFWNSGGGIFIAGVDDTGKIDGGIPEKIGRQKLNDWVDQVITSTEPTGPYITKIINKSNPGSAIQDNHVVLIISFGESNIGPHMAFDKKYYIRTGAHSGSVGHFLVEAIRARRGLQSPKLRGVIRMHEQKANVAELVIVSLNGIPALNIHLNFEPLPVAFADHVSDKFPLMIPVVDQMHPFRMDLSIFPGSHDVFGKQDVTLVLDFEDIAGRKFQEKQLIDLDRNIQPLNMNRTINEDTLKALKEISKQLGHLTNVAERYFRTEE